ncbi:MAG: GNAT family N-acetyltransferase [Candidatus Dormibacteria bacterium]|jgi:RimJ/RimL family protein N-acetyltransferase
MVPEEIDLGDIVLRRWRQEDAEALTAAIAESVEHLRVWMPWADRVTLEERRTHLAGWEREWEAGGDLVWGIFAGPAIAGSCGLHRRVGPGGFEIGYWVHAAHTRRGYATAAVVALTSVAVAQPGISFVEIHHDRANLASAAVPRKLGFELIGEARVEPRTQAESGVTFVWRMTRERWQPSHQGGGVAP